ncbi:MAG TPA: Gmad2 immunoglobulin-like domain-containing protein [Flavobacteriaceae bacterium]|nr:Gmad2 immunoglobulin-like domain-containing protein [Flavobacteriaceae bacterium]
MRKFVIFSLMLIVFGCTDTKKKKVNESTGARDPNKETVENKNYQSARWQMETSVPPKYAILESELPGEVPVINFYDKDNEGNPPFAYHEKPDLSYIAVFPKGFGTEMPRGKKQRISEWTANLSTEFAVDEEKSTVFLLENGQAWAYLLTPASPAKNWSQYGNIFVHFAVSDFESKCFTENNTEKPMEKCTVMGGTDRIALYGTVNPSSKNELTTILQSIQFISKEEVKTPISDLIKVEKPLPNIEVTSPLKVKGKARGYWFFEGVAGLRLEDKDGKVLAESRMKAQDIWMTEDFVPFTGTLKFDFPNDERGYLIFERANPSGKSENKKEYRLPILFPPRK